MYLLVFIKVWTHLQFVLTLYFFCYILSLSFQPPFQMRLGTAIPLSLIHSITMKVACFGVCFIAIDTPQLKRLTFEGSAHILVGFFSVLKLLDAT